ncbi:MAG: DUF445 family protein [Salinisphaeraceae bacterium]|nr:DUF445 family protein [Salinisphaeraceae bacterium]
MITFKGQELEVTRLDKRFRLWLLGTTVLFGIVRAVLPEENVWIHSIFIVLMAGMVGYFTNYLAIRMLFQPKQGKVLGWEGLVPKNKPKIARSLAESVQTRLLSPDIILEYIQQHHLIETATQRLSEWVDSILEEPEVRAELTERGVGLLRTHGDEILERVFNQAEVIIKEIAADPERVRAQWQVLRGKLANYLNDAQNRQQLTERVRKIFLEEVPRLAEMIDGAVEKHLKEQEIRGTIGMGLKRMFSINREAIESVLQDFASDPDSGDMLMRVMDGLVEDIVIALQSEETQEAVVSRVEGWVNTLTEQARKHVLPVSIDRLQRYLNDEASWDQIDTILRRAIEAIKDSFIEMLASEQGTAFIKQQLNRVVQRLNVTGLVEDQVMKLDTDELEDMILNNTGGNLVVIQILGGILGLIAGTVQVEIWLAVPLMGLMGIVAIAFWLNTRKYRKKTI